MQDVATLISELKRPKILIQAARFGIENYRRAARLPRIIDRADLPQHAQASLLLYALEAEHNDKRIAGHAEYVPSQHVEVLIALMEEVRLLNAARNNPVRVR